MSYILGVINKDTEKYENIISVDKKNKYKCIACDGDLILRKGEKNFQSFIHKNKNDCVYFKNPTESQLIHDASLCLKKLFSERMVCIFRKCIVCKFNIKMEIPNGIDLANTSDDIYLENKRMLCKIHSSNNYDGTISDDCYQINMLGLIQRRVTSFSTGKVELVCSKSMTCTACCQKYGLNSV